MARQGKINFTVSKKISGLLGLDKNISEEKVQVIQYGILCTLNTLEKMIVLIVIFGVIHRLEDLAMICACIIPVRMFIGGSHRSNSFLCMFQTLVTFLALVFLQEHIVLPIVVKTAFVIGLVVMIWSLAPMQSEKRPTYAAKKRMKFKAMALTALCCILQLCCCFEGKFSNMAGWAIAEILLENTIRIILRKRGDKHGRIIKQSVSGNS